MAAAPWEHFWSYGDFPGWHKEGKVRLSSSCPSLLLASSRTDGLFEASTKRQRMNMSESNSCMPPSRKMSVSSDSNTGDGEAVDSNVKIQINDITPSNSQEFLHTIVAWTSKNAIPAHICSTDECQSNKKQATKAEALTQRLAKKASKKELVRRQSWSSAGDVARRNIQEKLHIHKCWSLSSFDSDVEDIFYDAREIPLSPTRTSTTNEGSSQSISEGVKEKQRSFSAGSKEDVFMSLCGQAPGTVHSMSDISAEKPQPKEEKKKHSLAGLVSCKSPTDEEWLLAPRTPLQKSVSTPSIIAAQEVQEIVNRRDRDGKDSLFSSHRLSLHNVGESSIAMLQEEDEPEEIPNMFLPQFSLAGLLRENLLGSGIQDSDDDKSTFSKRKKRGSLFFRKKRNKDKDKEKDGKRIPHQFVSICYSTSAVCDICSKALANKLALRCENCLVTVHDSSCKDHVPDCKSKPSKLQSPPTKDKTNVPTLQVPPGSINYPSRYRHLLGPVSQSMIDLAGGKQSSQQSKEKRLSIGNNMRPQSLVTAVVSTVDSSAKQNTPPSSTPRRNYTPSGYSQWRRVATKLGVNKVICEEKEAEPVEDINTNITETNSASMESLDEGTQEISDIEDDMVMRLMDEEPEAWSATVDKKLLKKLRDKDVKRQEAIYELILTEKHHCLTLKVMQKIFAQGMMKELNIRKDMVERIFPCLEGLMEMHISFLHKLRERQREDSLVVAVGDLLLEQFQGKTADQMRMSYGRFCSQHKEALSLYKDILKSDRKFQSFIKKCSGKPLCKARGIPECILLVTQRVTKYPLLVDSLIKTTRDNKAETENLVKALACIKGIITQVNAAVAEKERETRLLEIYNKVDAKSTAFYKSKKFKKSDLLSNNRKLRHEGTLAWKSARGKTIDVHGIILSDVIVLLQESNQKYYFSSLDNKSAVVSLQKLLVREKAGQNSKGIYLISSNPNDPEMYELICSSTKEKKVWVQMIRESVEVCPDEDEGVQEEAEEDQKLEEERHIKLKELFGLMYEKDLGVAQVCEEKMKVLVDTLELLGYETEGFENLRYTPLLQKDDEETKQLLLSTLNNASRLASSLYASGSSLCRSVSSAGEQQSDTYVSPVLPKRAETFGGFDNPNKDNTNKVLILKKKLLHLKELAGEVSSPDQELYFSDASLHVKGDDSQGNCTPKLSSRQGSPEKLKQNHVASVSSKSNDRDSQVLTTPPLLTATGKDQLEQVAELTHHLSVLTCLLNHHFSNVESLRVQLTEMTEKLNKITKEQSQEKRERKSIYRPDHQLEELRNLQEQLSQERTSWQQERSEQEANLNKQTEELLSLKEQIQVEQHQLAIQRELLNKQLEALHREGIVISPLMGGESTTDDDESSCQDVCHHRRTASFDLQSMQQHWELSMSRQSWSGPVSEEQKHLPNSRFLLSLSASNLPLTVERGAAPVGLGRLCKTTSQHTQWREEDCSSAEQLSPKIASNTANGLIGCQATSETFPLVLSTTVPTLPHETHILSSSDKTIEGKNDTDSNCMCDMLNPLVSDSSLEQRHNETDALTESKTDSLKSVVSLVSDNISKTEDTNKTEIFC